MKTFKSPAIHRTPLYRVKAAYCGMRARCKNANGKNPTYANVKLLMSLDEFITWALPRYTRFISKYPNESPCTARFGDKGHYKIGNIAVISMKENQKQQVHAAPAKGTHGTISAYRYCHCDLCKAAKRKYGKDYRRSRGIKPRQAVGPKHGTRNAYTYHKCRCEACMKANRDYSAKLRGRARDSHGLDF